MNYGKFSPQFQPINTNLRMNNGGQNNYSNNQGNQHMMNQGMNPNMSPVLNGMNPSMSPIMNGANPNMGQMMNGANSGNQNKKTNFVPFQPPRVSSQGKFHPVNPASFSPTNFQNQPPIVNNNNKAMEIEISKLQEKLKEAVKINKMATVQINKLNEKVKGFDELKQKYESAKKENNELLEKMEAQQINFTTKNSFIEQKLEESKENLMSLLDVKLKLDQSKNDVESLKKTLKKNNGKMKELTANIEKIQQEKEDYKKEVEQLKEEIKQKEDEYSQNLEQQTISKEQEINNYQQEIEEYKLKIKEYQSSIQSLENTIKEQEDQIEVYKISEGDLTNLKKEFDQNLAQFEIKDKSIEEKTKQLNESIAENENLKKIVAEKEKEAVEYDYLKGVLEKKENEMNEIIKKNEDLEASNKNLSKTLEEEKKSLQEKIEFLEKANEELKKQNDENNITIKNCRSDNERQQIEMKNIENALSEAQEKLSIEKKTVISIQSEYNNCQSMYNQAMEAIKRLEDTQSLLQKQLEDNKMKRDEMTKNFEESQNILEQKANEEQILTQQNEENIAAKDVELRQIKEEFEGAMESIKSQYLEVKIYNDFLRKEIRKLKGIPENILIDEVNTEEIEANKDLYKQIENQRIQIENLKEQLEISLNL
ncbi:hypothetical protein BCR36DRAFT_112995 [Piromyces finnis]|uniref:Uncharacterized protein n=1 Tax=Piromyces finnis TaxID=1754191 RepID=A0A1Y1VK87_9FUNG|nr:hypothetical protein BCR36DRAFT_112995 [Piromyces finnis]|eukprot:ORX58492.1 hypothetical protein BCR36DRAFT_112995 [Piromyces finnis]